MRHCARVPGSVCPVLRRVIGGSYVAAFTAFDAHRRHRYRSIDQRPRSRARSRGRATVGRRRLRSRRRHPRELARATRACVPRSASVLLRRRHGHRVSLRRNRRERAWLPELVRPVGLAARHERPAERVERLDRARRDERLELDRHVLPRHDTSQRRCGCRLRRRLALRRRRDDPFGIRRGHGQRRAVSERRSTACFDPRTSRRGRRLALVSGLVPERGELLHALGVQPQQRCRGRVEPVIAPGKACARRIVMM